MYGKVYNNKTGELLKNKQFIVNISTFSANCCTNDNGEYSILINWTTVFPVTTYIKHREIVKHRNSRCIIIIINDQKYRVKDKWKKSLKRQRAGISCNIEIKLIENACPIILIDPECKPNYIFEKHLYVHVPY